MQSPASLLRSRRQKGQRKNQHQNRLRLLPLGVRSRSVSGLTICMPGGGLGQIANAIKDDPDNKNREEIIVLAGTNDVRNQAYQDLNSFAYVVDTTIQKVKEAVPENSKLTFLRLPSNPNDDAVDPDRRFKKTYLGMYNMR